jgi:hypothetical protein
MLSSARHAALIALLALPLAACQTTIRQMNDCRVGDWSVIGAKDGADGLTARFDDRRAFCAGVDGGKIGPDAPGLYQQGWVSGNERFWSQLGQADGRKGLPVSQYSSRMASDKVVNNKTPPNRPAYDQGWSGGNADYWRASGEQDGRAGHPASDQVARASAGQAIGFNSTAWQQGWRDGNYAYWAAIGTQDARDGVPERELTARAGAARARGLDVREDAYLAAWNKEIVEYWRRLGWNDATDGRDVNTRRADARARGLKFAEADYQQQWQARLEAYWRDAGLADGFGKPNSVELRIATASRDNVFVIAQTRALYEQAWAVRNAEYCHVDNAFAFGRAERRLADEVCGQVQLRARRAWLSGRDYAGLERKLGEVRHDLDGAQERQRDHRRRLERIDADIKRDADDKNRVTTADTAKADAKRERERKELHESLKHLGERVAELRDWEYRYDQKMHQIKRDLYRD